MSDTAVIQFSHFKEPTLTVSLLEHDTLTREKIAAFVRKEFNVELSTDYSLYVEPSRLCMGNKYTTVRQCYHNAKYLRDTGTGGWRVTCLTLVIREPVENRVRVFDRWVRIGEAEKERGWQRKRLY